MSPPGPALAQQLGQYQAARAGAQDQYVRPRPHRQDVEAVDGTCHRFGQDSRVEVEIVDRVTFCRRRHEVLGEPPGIGNA